MGLTIVNFDAPVFREGLLLPAHPAADRVGQLDVVACVGPQSAMELRQPTIKTEPVFAGTRTARRSADVLPAGAESSDSASGASILRSQEVQTSSSSLSPPLSSTSNESGQDMGRLTEPWESSLPCDPALEDPTSSPLHGSQRALGLPQDTKLRAGVELSWQEVAKLLRRPSQCGFPERPMRMDIHAGRCLVFVEAPKVARRPRGSDLWCISGGQKGATDYWCSPKDYGVRKRYGTIKLAHGGQAKYQQFSLLVGTKEKCEESREVVVFQTSLTDTFKQDVRSQSSFVFAKNSDDSHDTAVVNVRAKRRHTGAPPAKFMSFQIGSATEIELGAIVQQGTGVTLASSQGDFAEWHRRRDGEPVFAEGDVVGFDQHGAISRRTTGAAMLGVISRKAVVEGSTPAAHERAQYDTVAYCGVVPVRVRRFAPASARCDCGAFTDGVAVGDVLIPSGRNDGVAVVSSAVSSTSGRIATAVANCAWPSSADSGNSCDILVPSMVISPAETVRRGPSQTKKLLQRCRTMLLIFVVVIVTVAIASRIDTKSLDDHRRGSEEHNAADNQHLLPVDEVAAAYVVSVDSGIGRARSTYWSGVYASTSMTCNGKPVYVKKMGRAAGSGTELVLCSDSRASETLAHGLHWVLRSKAKGHRGQNATCSDSSMLPAAMHSTSDGSQRDVAGWAVDCGNPSHSNCTWISYVGPIQVLATRVCTHCTSDCGVHADSCFKVPTNAVLPSAKCDAPPVYSSLERHLNSTDSGCVACTCKTEMYIGQQYCANAFLITGAFNNRYSGTYTAVRNTFCNGKPVFQQLAPGHDANMYEPVLYQPTGVDWWAIDDGWDKHAFSLTATDPFTDGDHCPSTDIKVKSIDGLCPESPDGSGCSSYWSEEHPTYGRRNAYLIVRPIHFHYEPRERRYRNSSSTVS